MWLNVHVRSKIILPDMTNMSICFVVNYTIFFLPHGLGQVV